MNAILSLNFEGDVFKYIQFKSWVCILQGLFGSGVNDVINYSITMTNKLIVRLYIIMFKSQGSVIYPSIYLQWLVSTEGRKLPSSSIHITIASIFLVIFFLVIFLVIN